MTYIKVSIIIPVYNEEKHLKQCIASLTNQTLDNIEIICVDDGSIDNSLNIIKDFAGGDNRIKYFSLSDNSGAGIARNVGLNYARGEYISFVDADDFISHNTDYEKLYQCGVQNNAEIVSANLNIYHNHENIFPLNTGIKDNSPMLPQDYGIPWFFTKNLFKKDFLLNHGIKFPNYKAGEDPVFLAKALTLVERIYGLAIDFYNYRDSSPDSSPDKINTEEKEIGYIKHFKDVFEILKLHEFEKMRSLYEERMYDFFINQKFKFGSKTLENNIKSVFGDDSNVMTIYKLKHSLYEKDIMIKKLNSDLENTIQKFKSSNSWKLTSPLRKIGYIIRKFIKIS